MSDNTHYIEQLEGKLELMTKEQDKLRQDLLDVYADADAAGWALGEMNVALARAKAAELRAMQLERELGRKKAGQPVQEAPVPAKQLLVEDQPKPRERQVITPDLMGDLADVLGFPKEGR